MNVYIYSIKRAKTRQDLCTGGLLTMGTPHEKIKVFLAPDHADFDSIRHLCEAAIADGFPGFELFMESTRRPIVAQIWGFCQLFRELSEKGETALYLHDDAFLGLRYGRYNELQRELHAADPDFKFLGLYSNTSIKDVATDRRLYARNVYLIHKGIAYATSDHAAIVTPKFFEWYVPTYFETCGAANQFLAADEFFWHQSHKENKGCYTMPIELSTDRFPLDIVPSLLHVTEDIKKGKWTVVCDT